MTRTLILAFLFLSVALGQAEPLKDTVLTLNDLHIGMTRAELEKTTGKPEMVKPTSRAYKSDGSLLIANFENDKVSGLHSAYGKRWKLQQGDRTIATIGMSAQDLVKNLGEPDEKYFDEDLGEVYRYKLKNFDLGLTLVDEKLDFIDLMGPEGLADHLAGYRKIESK